jgi:O-antigen ligase
MVGLMAIVAVMGTAIVVVRPEYGIVLFLASFFMTYRELLPTQGRFTPNNLLGLLLFALLLLKIYQEKDLWFLKEKVVQILLAIVLVFNCASIIVERQVGNPVPELDLTGQMLHDLTTRFVFLIFFVYFIRTLRQVKMILWVVLGIVVVSAISGTVNSLQGTGFDGGYRATAEWGMGAAANANRLSFFCAFGIALSWCYREAVRSRVLKLLLNAAIPVLGLAALMTGSRSGLLNLLVVCGLFAMDGRFSLKRQLHLVVLCAAILFVANDFLSTAHLERLGNIFPGNSVEVKGGRSTEKRLQTVVENSKIIARNPVFGTGIGNARWVRLQLFGSGGSPHNSYLWAATEGGVVALALYLMLFGLSMKYLVDAERKSTRQEVRAIARGLRVSLVAFLFFTFFADFWLSIITYFLVGLVIILRRIQAQELKSSVVLRMKYQKELAWG